MGLGTLGLCYLLASGCFAATVNTQYVIDSWTSENGLPQNSVLSIGQTADGYLWFTTFDGLVRFDGVRFTVFKKGSSPRLTSSRFVQLFAEHDGTLWASTEDRGLIRYRDGRFQALTIANGLPSDSVIGIQRGADGSLLIETRWDCRTWPTGELREKLHGTFGSIRPTSRREGHAGTWIVQGCGSP